MHQVPPPALVLSIERERSSQAPGVHPQLAAAAGAAIYRQAQLAFLARRGLSPPRVPTRPNQGAASPLAWAGQPTGAPSASVRRNSSRSQC